MKTFSVGFAAALGSLSNSFVPRAEQSNSTALNVSVPVSAPSSAATLPSSFLSFSLEQDRWTDWSGNTSQNKFFFNTLDNLRQRSGAPPDIRIGANSEDHTNFREDVEFAELVFPDPTATVPYPEATQIVVGNSYYETARFLPTDTHVTWGVNFGGDNLTAAFLEAKAITRAFSLSSIKDRGIVLDFLEIGNEPDLYKNNGARASNYTVEEYVDEWTQFATNLTKAVGLSNDSHTKFLGASFAGSSHTTTGFSPQAIFAEGILDSPAGSLISTISEHHYSGSFCAGSEGLLQDLMRKDTIRGNLSMYRPDAEATRAQGLDYYLGETNSYSCHGAPGVSNTAGAALWTLDYLLQASQVGINKVFFHDGIGFKYNLIQPVTLFRSTLDASPLPSPLPPHVQPQYYAAIIATEAMGSSGSARVSELKIDSPDVAGYAFYEGDELKRAVLINSKAFTSGRDPESRTSVHVSLQLDNQDGLGNSTMGIKRLQIKFADDVSGLTFGGQSFETDDARPSGEVKEDTAKISDGVTLKETDAVLISFFK